LETVVRLCLAGCDELDGARGLRHRLLLGPVQCLRGRLAAGQARQCAGGHYFDNSHEKRMLSGENGHDPISGGAIRMDANEKFADWRELMRMQLDMVRNRYTVAAWAKRADTGSDEDLPRHY
jgi:hypothetical protein